jgi:hypothetical protein
LQWKQLGVLDLLEDPSQPFYVEWISNSHPSTDGSAHAKLIEIVIESSQHSDLKLLEDIQNKFIKYIHVTGKKISPLNQGIKEVLFEHNKNIIKID